VDLTPTEEERVRVHAVANLARETRSRGARLNVPEAIAIVCDELHLAARLGASYDEIVAAGRAAVSPDEVLDGVADVVRDIRVEVLLEEGTRLVVLRDPFGPPSADGPGATAFGEGDVELAPGRRRISLTVTNTSERPIRISSHFPFADANPRLGFDRDAARGFRLDLPAGDSIEWAPGQTREVTLVAYAGTVAGTDADA
jgi:urease subunit gamma/beta